MSNKTQEQYFGNYRGIVKKHGINGYCKIFFKGVYPEEYETNIQNLPWAEPASSLIAGASESNGVFQYPDVGSTVWAFFEAGNINQPIFFANTNNDKSKYVSGECSISYGDFIFKLDKNNNVITITNSKAGGKISLTSDIVEINGKTFNVTESTIINMTAPVINIKGVTNVNDINMTGTMMTGVSTINGFVPHPPIV